MLKIRVNWTLNKNTVKLILSMRTELKKQLGRLPSVSETIDFILSKVEDPITRKEIEIRELAVRINQLQAEIKELKKKGD